MGYVIYQFTNIVIYQSLLLLLLASIIIVIIINTYIYIYIYIMMCCVIWYQMLKSNVRMVGQNAILTS